MEIRKILEKHHQVSKLVNKRHIRAALEILKDFLKYTPAEEFRRRLENMESTYEHMLKYTIEGVNDPERDKVYSRLLTSILGLSDDLREQILAEYSGWQTYWLKSQIDKEQKLSGVAVVEKLEDLSFSYELDQLLKESLNTDSDSSQDRDSQRKRLVNKIFLHLWLTDKLGDAGHSLLETIRESDRFEWHEKSLFVSALSLSLLRYWEADKLIQLIQSYLNEEDQVRYRALTGLILAIYFYSERLNLYPELINRLEALKEEPGFREHAEIVLFQLVRARETEKISKKMHDEILPEMYKLRPRIEEKLDLENLIPDQFTEGKNPDWSSVFKESEDLFQKMEEFSKMQMEGADVFMMAFSKLKNFDFFNEIPHWFMPFYPDHTSIDEAFGSGENPGQTNEFAEALFKTPFMCNSDKYSFILNMKHLPEAQKKMLLDVFRMEIKEMDEALTEDQNMQSSYIPKTIITQYIQDLYRFVKISPQQKEMPDLFHRQMDFYRKESFPLLFGEGDTRLKLADFLFEKDYYTEAGKIYQDMEPEKTEDAQLMEKTAYCYQQNQDFEEALEWYKRADILDKKVWTVKKMGLCSRRLNQHKEAVRYYEEAERLDPENLHTQAMIGHCYLDMDEYEKALRHYFKVEYLDPENRNVLRPIAWCYAQLGNAEQAQKYYARLLEEKPLFHDFINAGHMEWCRGNRQEAVNLYLKGLLKSEISLEDFYEIMEDDRELLLRNGVAAADIPIVLDYLLYRLAEKNRQD